MIEIEHNRYKRVSGIYCIKNIANNKVYIGRTNNLYDRVIQHRKLLNTNKHANLYLQREYNKYSSENFIVLIVEECGVNALIEREEFFMIEFDSLNKEKGYNILSSLYGTLIVSEETKQKIREKSKGRIPVNALLKIKELNALGKNPRIGAKTSDRTKKKMSESKKNIAPIIALEKLKLLTLEGKHPNKGKKHSLERRLKQKQSCQNRTKLQKQELYDKLSIIRKNKLSNYQEKTCYVLDVNDNIIKEFVSVKDIIKEYPDFDYQIVRRICSGERKSKVYKNYTFKYK